MSHNPDALTQNLGFEKNFKIWHFGSNNGKVVLRARSECTVFVPVEYPWGIGYLAVNSIPLG
jgi:hypothetical protein